MATGSGTPHGGAADSEVGEVAVATRSWQSAEGRLYPLVTMDSDLYVAAVTLVVEARDLLRQRCDDVAALIDADPSDVLSECPSAAEVQAWGFDATIAFDAARAQRLRELGSDWSG